MNVYEAFGLLLVIGMVAMLLLAARAMGEDERRARRAEKDAEKQAEERANSEV